MSSLPPSGGFRRPQRRSERITLKTPVVVSMREGNREISENTRTVTVNAHGALILLGLEVEVGQLLTLRNPRSGDEESCRVAYLGPHQLVSAYQTEKREVGIGFMEPHPQFWFISFPPADWTPRSPD